MAKLAAKKKPTKPDAPKKPTSRSKTGNAECSQAASNWQLSIRGKATLNPGTYQTLAKCRALSKSGQMADAQGRTGKLSDQGAAALKGRLQKRFDSGLITQKSRQDRLETLLKQRADKGKAKPAQEAETVQERRESSNTAKLEDKYKLKKPITGPTGEKIVGYQWVNTTEEGMFRDRKVSDWSAAQTSVPTGRSIVHLFWVEGKDGKQTLMGRGAAQKSLGMPESKLVTVAKREADRQKNAILRGKKRSEDAEKYGESSAKMAIGRFITANPNSGRTPQVAFKNGKYVATISDEFKGELKDNGWSLMAPGRGTSARSAKAEFLLKKRSERGKLAPSKPAVQAAPQPAR